MSLLSQSKTENGKAEPKLLEEAVGIYKQLFDRENGGFDGMLKFPSPHNLLFLLAYYRRREDQDCLEMAERTLTQMYRGGLFDHIGGAFCRYSTDGWFLVPHFEKMQYNNALINLVYCEAYGVTRKKLYLLAVDFALRKMTFPEGGFYSAPGDRTLDGLLETVYQYRKSCCSLHLDDKILTSWNGSMIAALWDSGALHVSF